MVHLLQWLHLWRNRFSALWLPAPPVFSWHLISIPSFPPALTTDWPFSPKLWDIPAEISPGGRGGCAIIRKQILSNLRNRMKPQGWELGRISQMGRSGTVFWGKSSLFRWVLVNIYSYTLQLNQLLRPQSWCVIKEFQKNMILHDKNIKQNPSLPSALLNTPPNLSFPSFSV